MADVLSGAVRSAFRKANEAQDEQQGSKEQGGDRQQRPFSACDPRA